MDFELAPDDTIPEAPAPRSKFYVRERYKCPGWNIPPGNLAVVYLEACQRHKVPANSAVIAQLHRRARLMQPGPWQRVSPTEPLASSPPHSPPLATVPPSSPPSRAGPRARGSIAGHSPSPSISYGPSPSASYSVLAPSCSPSGYSYGYSQQALSAISSHMAVAAATQTSQELRDLIQGHVYPLTLTPAVQTGGDRSGGGGDGGGAPGSIRNHAETVRAAELAMALAEGDGEAGGGPMYSARAVAHVCQLVDPRTPWEQQLASWGLPPDCRVISEADFSRLLEAAASTASLGELRQAALEVLSRPVGHGTLDLEGLAGALFDYLDVSSQGNIPASELRAAVGAFSPAAAADMYGLMERYPYLARISGEPVSRLEFVEVLVGLAPGLAPAGSSAGHVRDKMEIAINAILDSKIREPYGYDFSRCYLGPRGLLPVLDALGCDSSFTSLSLANCGLGCGSVITLVEWLQGHPNLTSLDLTNNLIADRGGLALTHLLKTQPRIVQLGIGSTYLVPQRPSRTHHDTLGPSPCEDGGPLLEALAANRAARRSSAEEIVRALRQHGPELRALCYSLLARDANGGKSNSSSSSSNRLPGGVPGVMADSGVRCATPPPGGHSDSRVPMTALREALTEVTAEWGFTADALDEVLHHERLLGTATAGRTADDSGRLGVTYDELMQFLRSEDQVVRVAQAFRNHLVEAKRIFFALAPEPATAASISAAGVAGPRTALSTVRQAIIAAASQPGSGWDVSEADLESVMSPAFMRANCRAAAAGTARPPALVGGGVAAAGLPPALRPDGLLVPEWATAASAGGGSAAMTAAGGAPAAVVAAHSGGDMLISWPELANTLLYLFSR